MMETAPSTDSVYEGVYALYNNPDTAEKEKASKWLELLQKSVYSWSIADELLQQKRDIHSCYFAAQTMRSKIQTSFHELPVNAHESLRDSLMVHISQINGDTDPVIVTQLCLALADLALLMSSWINPVLELIEKLSCNANTIWPLIVIITLIPEEINSKSLRLGANRREEIMRQMELNSRTVFELLVACLKNCIGEQNHQNLQMILKVIKCFNSWICIHVFDVCDVTNNLIVAQCFNILNDESTEIRLHDTSSDCICTLLQCIESYPNDYMLHLQMFNSVIQLENAYLISVAHEDSDKATNYCRIFTALAESFLDKFISINNSNNNNHNNNNNNISNNNNNNNNNNIDHQSPQMHYSIKSLDLVLTCVGHYDYEVAEVTFNLWYRLSEDLYKKNDDFLTLQFRPYIERLISALFRHSQIDPDHEGLIEDSDLFYDFRGKVSDLIRDVVFIIGSSNCFKQMFLILQDPNVTWESSEAALFVMANVAKNILPEENEVVPKVAEAILNLPENTHIAVRYTSITLLGELCEWIDQHPESLESVLNFLLYSLQQKNGLAASAAAALTSICTACRVRMTCHLNGLIEIARSLDSFEITNDSAIGLLKGISTIISRLPKVQITKAVREICSFQIGPLCALIENNVKVDKHQRTDPSFWLDRLAVIIRHILPEIRDYDEHPCLTVIKESWQVITNVLNKYQNDVRIMERTARCIRYAMRSIGKHASCLLDSLVEQMINLYGLYQHSCFLYLGSILVDEFAGVNDQCTKGLLDMMQAFIEPTFNILQIENGLKNHPDMVDDFFRLCCRFIQRCPLHFLQSPIVSPILQCALLACTLDHRDANISVMRFFVNLLSLGRNEKSNDSSQTLTSDTNTTNMIDVSSTGVTTTSNNQLKCHLVHQIVQLNGESLTMNLLHASVFCLHSYMLSDVADVLFEMKLIDNEKLGQFLRNALDALPKKNSGGYVTATQNQLNDFHMSILRATTSKQVTYALKEFTRLYR